MQSASVVQSVCSFEAAEPDQPCQKRVFTTCDQCGKPYCSDHLGLRAPGRYLCYICTGDPVPPPTPPDGTPAPPAAPASAGVVLLGFGLGSLPLGTPIFLAFGGWNLLSFVFDWLLLWPILYVAAWAGALVALCAFS